MSEPTAIKERITNKKKQNGMRLSLFISSAISIFAVKSTLDFITDCPHIENS